MAPRWQASRAVAPIPAALTATGEVKCWGSNRAGQLGDGTTTSSSTPVDVSDLSDVTAVYAGGSHTCAVSNGGVKCWGANSYGQLGDGTLTSQNAPVDVSGLSSGVQKVTTGGAHTCALTTDGGVKCWGYNRYGQLGDGPSFLRRTRPVDVSGLSAGVTDVMAGQQHTCALVAGGGVKCWGYNLDGQLGDGTTTSQNVPVDVSELSSGVTALAQGQSDHTCALTSGGGVKCWGLNYYGQLGDGTTTTRSSPFDVSGLSSGVIAVAGGFFHTCAVTSAGRVVCWGNNYLGQLGNGVPAGHSLPVAVRGLGTGVTAVAAGGNHTCALLSGGVLKCWGDNSHGQLGDGTSTSRDTPVDVIGIDNGATAVTGGQAHTCALTSSGGVKCWGSNYAGQLGDGTTVDRYEPVDVIGLTGGVQSVVAGRSHTCAITSAGGLKCWGDGGQLGNGTTGGSSVPVDVSGLSTGVAAVAPDYYHTCALMTAGGVKCWGFAGLVGDGTTIDRYAPVDVSGLTNGVVAIAVDGIMTDGHACALMVDAGVKCWGSNTFGKLGDGTTDHRYAPVDVEGIGGGVAAITAGGGHVCALMTSGGVKCWGLNNYGQIGDGTTTNRALPVEVDGLAGSAVALTAGGTDVWGVSQDSVFTGHTCALMSDGAVNCWGSNVFGQLGVKASWWPTAVPGFGPAADAWHFMPLILMGID